MKHLKLILAALILGIGLATFTHTALAQKGIKLVADEDNDIGSQLSAAISENSVIVGSISQTLRQCLHSMEKTGQNKRN